MKVKDDKKNEDSEIKKLENEIKIIKYAYKKLADDNIKLK